MKLTPQTYCLSLCFKECNTHKMLEIEISHNIISNFQIQTRVSPWYYFFQCHVNERSYLAGNKKGVRLEWDCLISMMKKIMELTYFSWWGKWYTIPKKQPLATVWFYSKVAWINVAYHKQCDGQLCSSNPKTGTLKSRVHYKLVLILEPSDSVT